MPFQFLKNGFDHCGREFLRGKTVTAANRSEEHTSELQSRLHLVCRLLLEKKNTNANLMGVLQEAIGALNCSFRSGRVTGNSSRHRRTAATGLSELRTCVEWYLPFT